MSIAVSTVVLRMPGSLSQSCRRVVQTPARCFSRASFCSLRCRQFHASQRRAQQSPADVAAAFLAKFANGKAFARKQLLDANQLRLFSLTLDRPHIWPSARNQVALTDSEPAAGTPIPAGYHLAYFTPPQLPGSLGIDGTDTSYNPDSPFTRRMWAGGSIQWPGADPTSGGSAHLRVGDVATEVTRVVSCEPKVIKKTGEAMLVVGVVKEFLDSKDNVCVVDNRNWVFREALDPSKPARVLPRPPPLSSEQIQAANAGMLVRPFCRQTSELFRFSALTFNPHRIHYDKPWAIEVEGHRNTVVHGPLNMVSILDFWRDLQKGKEVVYPKSLEYRATSPVYVEEPYRILIDEESLSQAETPVAVQSDDGTQCMKAKIQRW